MTTLSYDAVVIGGGPAGSSAAAWLARNKWKTLLLDQALEDGYLGSLGNVSYFPGQSEPVTGAELVRRLRRQAEQAGVELRTLRAEIISIEDGSLAVQPGGGEHVTTRAVVLATGAAARSGYLHGEKEFMGRGVSHDAATDGPLFAHHRVAVVGKTQHAAQEALRLARYVDHVVFIIPSSKLDVPESLMRELRHQTKIEHYLSTSLKKINGGDHVSSITVFTGGQEKDIEVHGVFPYVHEYHATSAFLKGMVELSPSGAVKIDHAFNTSVKGVFACGDLICALPQMPAIACAQGILAALSVDKYLCSL